MLSPIKGKRSSCWSKKRALPPRGTPVAVSRGPAWSSGNSSVRGASAAEEALGQGNRVGGIAVVMKRSDIAEFGAAGEDQAIADGVVSGVADQKVNEVALRAEEVFGEAEIDGIVEALV